MNTKTTIIKQKEQVKMRNSLIKSVMIIFFFTAIALTSAYAGAYAQKDSTKSEKTAKAGKCENMDKCTDKSKCKSSDKCTDMSKCTDKDMSKCKSTGKAMSMDSKKSNKAINVKSFDKNKDGKVYECPMDWDVLSDKPGKDPKCGMELAEVTVEQAKKNLTDHGFKVK